MQVGILGPLQVRAGDRQLSITGSRLRALVTRLAADAPGPVSIAELVEAVWPGDPPADPTNALQTLVSRVRRALGDASRIQQVAGGYRLTVDARDVDATAFGDLVAAGRRELAHDRPRGADEQLTRALSLWRGEPLVDAADGSYATSARIRLDELRLDARIDLIEARLLLGRAVDVIAELEQLLAAHPLRERLAGQLMRALASTGRQADALAVYERLRDRLGGELGVDPGAQVQAVHLAVLRGEVAPAPAADTGRRRTNLRIPLTRLIGRDPQVRRITDLLADGRLVTIVGPGGAGKTRLAQEIGTAATATDHRDGVWLVELAAVTETKGIVPAMIGALGLLDTRALGRRLDRSARDSVEYLFDVLADAGCLLVVDNCEHLVAPVAELIDALLARSPGLRVLATSREPLGIVGEALCVVPPLDLPPVGAALDQVIGYPAARLLVERGRAVASGFDVREDTVADVIEIVRRLDGLPLAIELAAARLRVMPVGEIAARLSDRFRLLTGGSRTAVPRHRTLRAVVEWSWDLLEADERLLVERLAVFPAGATPGSAGRVCADERLPADRIPDLMLTLVDKSLLTVIDGQTARYRMLETIREYGLERLAERGEITAARSGHARYFARMARRMDPALRTPNQLQAIAALSAERDNLGAALRTLADSDDPSERDACLDLVLDLSWLWQMIGAEAEATSWVSAALAATEGHDHPGRVWAQGMLALMSALGPGSAGLWVDDLRTRCRRIARDLAAALPPPNPQFALLPVMLALVAGDPDTAGRVIDATLAEGDPWTCSAVLLSRALFAENEGEIDRMRADVDAALTGFEQIGDRWGLSSVLSARGGLRALDGDTLGGIADYEKALVLAGELGSTDDESMLRMRLAGLRTRTGNFDGAAALLDRVQADLRDRSQGVQLGMLATGITATITLLRGDVAGAQSLAAGLRRDRCQRGSDLLHGHVSALISAITAVVAVHAGDVEQAVQDVRAGYPTAVATHDQPVIAVLGVAVGWVVHGLGRPAESAVILGAAARLRGGDDAADPTVSGLATRLRAELGEEFDGHYQAGKTLTRDEAIGVLDPDRRTPTR